MGRSLSSARTSCEQKWKLSAIGLQYVPYGTDDFVLHVMDDRVEIWITDWKRAAKKVCIHKEKLM